MKAARPQWRKDLCASCFLGQSEITLVFLGIDLVFYLKKKEKEEEGEEEEEDDEEEEEEDEKKILISST